MEHDTVSTSEQEDIYTEVPDSMVHGADMGPTWFLSSPGGSHVGPINLAISCALKSIVDIKTIYCILATTSEL